VDTIDNRHNRVEEAGALSVEVLSGQGLGIMMSVPCGCGLMQGDLLRVDGLTVIVMRLKKVLAIDFPVLSPAVRESLLSVAGSGQQLVVGEFTALGVSNCYWLNVLIVN
jgi:hypothetical protein